MSATDSNLINAWLTEAGQDVLAGLDSIIDSANKLPDQHKWNILLDIAKLASGIEMLINASIAGNLIMAGLAKEISNTVDDLAVGTKYLQFDLDATIREFEDWKKRHEQS